LSLYKFGTVTRIAISFGTEDAIRWTRVYFLFSFPEFSFSFVSFGQESIKMVFFTVYFSLFEA